MQGRSAESIFRSRAVVTVLAAVQASLAADPGLIVKPPDGAWIRGEEVEIIAKAAGGRLFVDGKPVEAAEPFPGVYHARVAVPAGRHAVRLESPGGLQEVVFHAGTIQAGQEVEPYTDHPPFQTACTHCHSVSRRGRFRFSGGCQTCHASEQFIRRHSHEPHELASCGMCHDAHGSSKTNLLVMPVEQACRQCHN